MFLAEARYLGQFREIDKILEERYSLHMHSKIIRWRLDTQLNSFQTANQARQRRRQGNVPKNQSFTFQRECQQVLDSVEPDSIQARLLEVLLANASSSSQLRRTSQADASTIDLGGISIPLLYRNRSWFQDPQRERSI